MEKIDTANNQREDVLASSFLKKKQDCSYQGKAMVVPTAF